LGEFQEEVSGKVISRQLKVCKGGWVYEFGTLRDLSRRMPQGLSTCLGSTLKLRLRLGDAGSLFKVWQRR